MCVGGGGRLILKICGVRCPPHVFMLRCFMKYTDSFSFSVWNDRQEEGLQELFLWPCRRIGRRGEAVGRTASADESLGLWQCKFNREQFAGLL
jgi:hypothetical protein